MLRPSRLVFLNSLESLRRGWPEEHLHACAALRALVSFLDPRAHCFPSCFCSSSETDLLCCVWAAVAKLGSAPGTERIWETLAPSANGPSSDLVQGSYEVFRELLRGGEKKGCPSSSCACAEVLGCGVAVRCLVRPWSSGVLTLLASLTSAPPCPFRYIYFLWPFFFISCVLPTRFLFL